MMRVFGYLKTHPNGTVIVDPALPDHDKYKSPEGMNWEEFYPDARTEEWQGMPKHLANLSRSPVTLMQIMHMTN